MNTSIAPFEITDSPLASLAAAARDYAANAKAENTLRADRADWQDFAAWCQQNGLEALPARSEGVALYLTAKADTCKVNTLQRRLSAISQAHTLAGFESPTKSAPVRLVWQGIKRTKGIAPATKTPTLTADLRQMVMSLPDGPLGVRDRALLLLGFAGAFRRSELVSLNRENIKIDSDGITVTLSRSKTDQEGEGRKVGIPYGSRPDTCPVRALLAWIEAAGITEGALFRPLNRHGQILAERLSDKAVSRVVKRAAEAAGFDPTQFAGHSLRAGLATSAAAAGVSERIIMQQTGHKSVLTVRRYIRDGNLFRENAAGSVGL